MLEPRSLIVAQVRARVAVYSDRTGSEASEASAIARGSMSPLSTASSATAASGARGGLLLLRGQLLALQRGGLREDAPRRSIAALAADPRLTCINPPVVLLERGVPGCTGQRRCWPGG